MRIAITGATGGLGRNLVTHFLERGYAVTAFGRNAVVGAQLEREGARFHAGDLNDELYLARALRDHEFVVHSAALASPWGQWSEFEHVNVRGTETVLRACAGLPLKRFVHISTPSIYFSGRPQENIREDDPLPPPQTHYARSKLQAEFAVRAAALDRGLPAMILRPRALFGPHDQAILPRLLRVMEKGVFPLPAGGRARVDVTAVQNVAHAVDLALRADAKYIGRVYNITNDEPMTVRELSERVRVALGLRVRFVPVPLPAMLALAGGLEFWGARVAKREPALTRYSAGLLGITQTLDISRAKTELGYRPIMDVQHGLETFASWWRHHARRV